MAIENIENAHEQLKRAATITDILDSEIGQEQLKTPGFLASMQKQAKEIGEELPEKYRATPTPAK